jgi:hypothetical protein
MMEFSQAIASINFDATNIPLFSQFFDEVALFDPTRRSGLLPLLYGQISERVSTLIVSGHPPVVPRLPTPRSPHYISATEVMRRLYDLIDRMDAEEERYPYPCPVPEGCDRVEVPEGARLADLIAGRRYMEAISLVSAGLDADPKNAALLKERVKLLVKVDKFADAIRDCVQLIEIEPSLETRQLRTQLWKHLGEGPRTQDQEQSRRPPYPPPAGHLGMAPYGAPMQQQTTPQGMAPFAGAPHGNPHCTGILAAGKR